MFIKKLASYSAVVGAALLLSACPLTDGDIKRIDDAEDNLQKIALDPKIVSPSDQETVTGVIDVLVDVDTSVEYEKVTLQVGVDEVGEDLEAPYTFELDTTTWAKEEKITLLAKAYMVDGNQLRSETINVILQENAVDVKDPKIVNPSNDETVNASFDVRVELDDAIRYEKVILQAEGIEIAVDSEAPFAFNVEPYFFGAEQKVALNIKAVGINGKTYSSEVVNVVVGPEVQDANKITSPTEGATFDAQSTVSVTWKPIQDATGYQIQLNDGPSIVVAETSYEFELDEFNLHNVKVRAVNQYGQYGEWSEHTTFSTGLFAYALDVKATAGWSHYDRPVDFIIDEEDFVILSSGSDKYDDGSGDSSHVTLSTISKAGKLENEVAFSQYQNPNGIQESQDGYLISASKSQNGDVAVIEVNDQGTLEWSFEKTGNGRPWNNQGEDFSIERIYAAIELDDDTILLSGSSYSYEQYKNKPEDSWWSSRLTHSETFFSTVDKTSKTETKTLITNPADGEYSFVNQFLITDADIKAVGKFKSVDGGNDGSSDSYEPVSASGSGAVLFSLGLDGVLDETKTVTGGGPANEQIESVAQLPSGQFLVGFSGYDRSGVTEFSADLSDSRFSAVTGMRYGRLAAHSTLNEYLFAGSKAGNYESPKFKRLPGGDYNGVSFTGYSNELSIVSIKHDPNYGYVILATDKNLNGAKDSYTVLFNISDTNKFIAPKALIQKPNHY